MRINIDSAHNFYVIYLCLVRVPANASSSIQEQKLQRPGKDQGSMIFIWVMITIGFTAGFFTCKT
jgi:hypothetical protein